MGLLWVLGALVAVTAAYLLHRSATRGRRLPLLALLLGSATTAAAASFVAQSGHYWNSVRTVIPVALARGIPIYHRPGEGPLWANIYPPLGWAMLTPTALGSTPDVAIAIGQALCALFILAPLLLAVACIRGTPRGQILAFTLGLALAATATLAPLQDVTYAVHVDAPALGLGMLACALMTRLGDTANRKWLFASGAVAAASIFCKQTMLPLPAVLTIWALMKWGKSAGISVLAGALASVALLGILACTFFDPRALIYCVLTVPSHQPLDDLGPALRLGLIESAKWILPLAILTALALWRSVKLSGDQALLFLLAALAEVPFAAAAYLKVGGDKNNLAYILYFLLAAFLCAIASTFRTQRNLIRASGVLAILAAIAVAFSVTPTPNQHRQAFDLLKARPGLYYFPWLPLSHLLAEDRQTHQSWGITDRLLAGEQVPPAWLGQYIPSDAAFLCLRSPPSPSDAAYARLAAEYSRSANLPELPGWYCFTKPQRQLQN